jgi:hypothetical protein
MDVIVLAVVCLDCGVRVMARYRFRLYPGPAQEQMLARTFGCARVAAGAEAVTHPSAA